MADSYSQPDVCVKRPLNESITDEGKRTEQARYTLLRQCLSNHAKACGKNAIGEPLMNAPRKLRHMRQCQYFRRVRRKARLQTERKSESKKGNATVVSNAPVLH